MDIEIEDNKQFISNTPRKTRTNFHISTNVFMVYVKNRSSSDPTKTTEKEYTFHGHFSFSIR